MKLKSMLMAAMAMLFCIPAHSSEVSGTITDYQRLLGCNVSAGVGFSTMLSDLKWEANSIPASPNGFIGNAGIGCDLRFSKVLLGGWAEYNFGQIDANYHIDGSYAKVALEDSYAVGIRAGYYVQPTTLLFARFGWAGANAVVRGDGSAKSELTGLLLGGGIEADLFDPIAVRITADYTFWHDKQFLDTTASGNSMTAMTALVYKF